VCRSFLLYTASYLYTQVFCNHVSILTCLKFGCVPQLMRPYTTSYLHMQVQASAASLNFALHLRIAIMHSAVWKDYVNTHSNVANSGSRVGVSCEVASSLGIKLKRYLFQRCRLVRWLCAAAFLLYTTSYLYMQVYVTTCPY
jgi:hypothetical protein